MKRIYIVVAIITATLPSLFLLHQKERTAEHNDKLQECTQKIEQIRVEADRFSSVDLYPFQEYRQKYNWVSDFVGGLAAFSGTPENRERKGVVDFEGNVVLEYQGSASIDGFPGFAGFKGGYTGVFVYEYEAVPWGFLLPYGNPVPKLYGMLDCTGKVTFEGKGRWLLMTDLFRI